MIILLDEAYREGVGHRFDGHDVRYFPSSITDPHALAEAMRPADVVGFRRVLPFAFQRDMVTEAPNLKFVHRSGSGADWFDLGLLSKLGILVAVNSGFNSPSVAEHTVLLTLLTLRRSLDFIDSMREGKWLRDLPGAQPFMLNGRTVGIIGVGAVGGKVARALLGLEARVICYQRDREVALPAGAQWAELDAIFSTADVISLHVPLVEETRQMIDRRALGLMKPTTVLINTSRGQIVDQAAMIEALQTGGLRAAGLDVFEDEPLAPDHVLRSMPNVITTPHVGGAGIEIVERQVEGTLSNIALYLSGARPERLVNPEILKRNVLRARHLMISAI
ncbi:NAD(P)-dependent oxidoreductase [Neorhizobium galegae]|uniref:D-3-phosphoglycerate dehydrogenase SerA4 n=1 Tax=Neorhizobium galegae bv. orientalis str. HAMBI 540 TaxID=1028800 RepID=A0A068T0P1_NEOGA|nr:NAD(P)-dependent oxidoreductase [Neorhizobium galegae]MCQ1854597.1 NAD(P)-binding domain-containing protein [Neorhizobium galegae]CDN51953.1 D-3-phosphoglycerate dehydrogenase SerA4 [Neorhizobium galegae bv. orientalis str. HAMBI 540]CDZ51516.1 D-3-phosphoglycerate dehydrogenase SerA4 [Neorhizobium galegae bv. orientalis]